VTPRVTVVLPTYNWATVLPFSIGSVLDQTFGDFELLVVGDCCTDESEAVVGAVRDERVRWINLPARVGHQAGPNNEGLRQARGEIVAYLGHDDLWLPRHLELLLESERAFAHGHVVFVMPDEPPTITPARDWSYTHGAWIPPTSVVHRRDAALGVGGWRLPRVTGSLDPEADLWARIAERHGPPALEALATSVKLPAAHRRDVYRDRPHREQSAWLRRIREAGDPERELLAAYADMPVPPPRPVPGIPTRVVRKLRRRFPRILGAPPGTAQDRYRRTRSFKGLDD